MPPTGDPSAQPPVGPGPALADVLPSVARSLGVPWGWSGSGPATPGFDLPPTRRAVTVLVDGLGHDLLVRRAGHAPWLRAHLAATRRVASGLPVDHGHVDGHLRHRPRGRRPRAARLRGARARRRPAAQRAVLGGRPRPAHLAAARDGLRGGGRGRGRGRAGRAGLLRRLGAHQRRHPRGPVRRRRHPCRSGSTRPWPRCAPRRGRSCTCTGATSTRSATCTAATPGSGATSSRASTASSPGWPRSLPDDCSLTVTADHGMVDSPHELRLDVAARAAARGGRAARHQRGAGPPALRRAGRPRRRARRVGRACSATAASCSPASEAVAAGWFGAVAPDNLAPDR